MQKNDPQGYGSALTYARRYGLAAMVGVCPDDDDAAAASPAPPKAAPRAAASPAVSHKDATPTTASEVARKWFFATVKEQCGISPDEAKALLGIKSFTEDFGDKTFEQILGFVKLAQLRQQKEAMSAAN